MNIFVNVALFGWIPVVVFLFATMPPRRAVLVGFVGAWLFLPVAGLSVPGLPDYTKVSATSLGVLLGIGLFDLGRLTRFRPKWYDLPMAVFCVSPSLSSLTNELGAYDAASVLVGHLLTWGIPYLVGRLYFSDAEGLRELAVAIAAGGLIYAPLCLWESRMSPQLNRQVYGFAQQLFVMSMRLGGYRPMVFMASGLEIGMWMGAATLAAYALWASGARDRILGLPLGRVALPFLVVTFLFCRSTGAMALTMAGVGALWSSRWLKLRRSLPIWLLLAMPPVYMVTRGSGVWSGEELVTLATRVLGADRAQSLQFRFDNEDVLREKALERPWLGWGGWGRSRVFDDSGRDVTITDGLWIILLGSQGVLGLAALTLAIMLPAARLAWRLPLSRWLEPDAVGAAAVGTLVVLWMCDNLLNAMLNPIYVVAAGGLMGLGAIGGPWARPASPGEAELERGDHLRDAGRAVEAEAAYRRVLTTAGRDSAEVAAAAAEELARCLLARGQVAGAIEARRRAVRHRHDGSPAAEEARAASLNDLAWLLAEGPVPSLRDPAAAVDLAEQAATLDPSRPTIWNTLGAAYYRCRRLDEAIAALEHAGVLTDDGSAVASAILLAMCYHHRGEVDRAAVHLAKTEEYLAATGPASTAVTALLDEARALSAEATALPPA